MSQYIDINRIFLKFPKLIRMPFTTQIKCFYFFFDLRLYLASYACLLLALPVNAEDQDTRQKRIHKRLDHLAAQGYGLIQDQAKIEPVVDTKQVKREMTEEEGLRATRQLLSGAPIKSLPQIEQETKQRNLQSARDFEKMLHNIRDECNGEFPNFPKIGMNDAQFRACTRLARLGGVTQIIILKEDKQTAKLYLFASDTTYRIYVIDDIVTAIKSHSR
jgi:hypothetical protein